MRELIIASMNAGKIREYKNAFKSLDINLKSLLDYQDEMEIEETGSTFKENALIKAREIYKKYNLPVIADDSGLVVNVLKNLLGVKSKRFSVSGTDEDNIALLTQKLKNESDRLAYFVTVICFYVNENDIRFYEGKTSGIIIDEQRGNNGFGYDPIFWLEELNKTYAELSLDEKALVSHRGKAIKKLLEDIYDENFSF